MFLLILLIYFLTFIYYFFASLTLYYISNFSVNKTYKRVFIAYNYVTKSNALAISFLDKFCSKI